MEGPGSTGEGMSAAMLGGVVVGASVAAATLICTGLCLALWCRRLRAEAGEPSPATFLVSKRKPGPYSTPDHPMAFVMPTITHSEAGSESRTPTPTPTTTTTITPTLTPTGDRPRWAVRPILSPTGHPRTYDMGREIIVGSGGVQSGLYSPPSYSPTASLPSPNYPLSPPFSSRPSQRPRSASPRTLLPKAPSTRTPPPPLSLPLGGRRWTTGTQTSPITPATPPGLLPRSIFLRKGVQGLEELRAALHHTFLTSDLASPDPTEVTTPDSVDSWAPVWTPASSIGTGGGCGLGEVQVRVRYMVRARQLTIHLHSAHQLPLRLGPHPVSTYTKAVLLPEKRVRFSTSTVPATDRAAFHATFTHHARPTRLANTTLRLSVCQVTDCGRRVVVGYASISMAALGIDPGLAYDIDTGFLNLPLQESAPDQQVGAGGRLEVGLAWDRLTSDLSIRVCRLSNLHLPNLQHPLDETAQVYVKVTVYLNNSILCWRRTSPKDLDGGKPPAGRDWGKPLAGKAGESCGRETAEAGERPMGETVRGEGTEATPREAGRMAPKEGVAETVGSTEGLDNAGDKTKGAAGGGELPTSKTDKETEGAGDKRRANVSTGQPERGTENAGVKKGGSNVPRVPDSRGGAGGVVGGVSGVLEVEETLSLHMPELDLDATHLVLSARLRTRPGCGRRVIGSCLVGRGGCVGEEGRDHWQDMLRAAPDTVIRTHTLSGHAEYHEPHPHHPHLEQQDSYDLPPHLHLQHQESYDLPPRPHDSYDLSPHHQYDQASLHRDSFDDSNVQSESFEYPSSQRESSGYSSSQRESFELPNIPRDSYSSLPSIPSDQYEPHCIGREPYDASNVQQESLDHLKNQRNQLDHPSDSNKSLDHPNGHLVFDHPPAYDEFIATDPGSQDHPPTYSESITTHRDAPDRPSLHHDENKHSSTITKEAGHQAIPTRPANATHIDHPTRQSDHPSKQYDHPIKHSDHPTKYSDPPIRHSDPITRLVDHPTRQFDHPTRHSDPTNAHLDLSTTHTDHATTPLLESLSTRLDHPITQLDPATTLLDPSFTHQDHSTTSRIVHPSTIVTHPTIRPNHSPPKHHLTLPNIQPHDLSPSKPKPLIQPHDLSTSKPQPPPSPQLPPQPIRPPPSLPQPLSPTRPHLPTLGHQPQSLPPLFSKQSPPPTKPSLTSPSSPPIQSPPPSLTPPSSPPIQSPPPSLPSPSSPPIQSPSHQPLLQSSPSPPPSSPPPPPPPPPPSQSPTPPSSTQEQSQHNTL